LRTTRGPRFSALSTLPATGTLHATGVVASPTGIARSRKKIVTRLALCRMTEMTCPSPDGIGEIGPRLSAPEPAFGSMRVPAWWSWRDVLFHTPHRRGPGMDILLSAGIAGRGDRRYCCTSIWNRGGERARSSGPIKDVSNANANERPSPRQVDRPLSQDQSERERISRAAVRADLSGEGLPIFLSQHPRARGHRQDCHPFLRRQR
jgi:hypothetical protein